MSFSADNLGTEIGVRLVQDAQDQVRAALSRSFDAFIQLFTRLLGSCRCDVLTDTDPPLCQHCKQYGFECTFFLPIGETRFKKKKIEDQQQDKDKDPAQHSSPSGGAPPDTRVYGTLLGSLMRLWAGIPGAPQRENAKDADGNLS